MAVLGRALIFLAPAVALYGIEAAVLRSDFSFEVVARHSSTTTPTFYQATAAGTHWTP